MFLFLFRAATSLSVLLLLGTTTGDSQSAARAPAHQMWVVMMAFCLEFLRFVHLCFQHILLFDATRGDPFCRKFSDLFISVSSRSRTASCTGRRRAFAGKRRDFLLFTGAYGFLQEGKGVFCSCLQACGFLQQGKGIFSCCLQAYGLRRRAKGFSVDNRHSGIIRSCAERVRDSRLRTSSCRKATGFFLVVYRRVRIAQEGQGILFTGIRELFDRAQRG